MRLDALQVEIRPRSGGQTVSLAARLVQRRPGPILVAWLLYSVPVLLLSLALLLGTDLARTWVWLLTALLAPVFSLPLTCTVGYLVFSADVRVSTVLAASLRRTPAFLLLFVATRLVTVAGLAALIVPGLFLWRESWFLGPIVLLEASPLGASLQRARRFAVGFQGHVLGHAATTGAVLLYATLALGSVFHFAIGTVLGQSVAALAGLVAHEDYGQIVGLVGFALALPLATIIWFFVYLDVRTRKEGWDLEIAFRARARRLERGRA